MAAELFLKLLLLLLINMLAIIILLVPFPSIQHFIWPLHWCLLADICNHTWIPECGEEDQQAYTRRLFIDECDMYEYNCDNERDYEMVNYSDCFLPATGCPTVAPCPSNPPCPNHNYHRMGQKYPFMTPARRMMPTQTRTRRTRPQPSLPLYMLRGKRRYTPKPMKKLRHTTSSNNIRRSMPKTAQTTVQTVILRREKIVKNGRTFVKIVRGIVKRKGKTVKGFDADDFLE